ncbi:MAG: peptidase [Gammaproteobacteria bacterium]|jgi:predicted HD phosphohydrolase|nr:MAG: peptidase [Gammaproteobacteria bacterium]
MEKQATFSEMKNGTAEDYAIIGEHGSKFASELPNRILAHLDLLRGDTGGFAVDRFTHSIQTATRAHRDGKDEEYVVCALLHDIGDTIASANHADLAATMLEPFVSEKNYWIVKHHGIFQGYYFFEHLGLDKNMRDQFKGHEFWNDCAEFCSKYDQNSFDPEYENMDIKEFIPMVHNVFAKPRNSIYKKRDY